LFTDGRDYWLGDGFHRVLAARKARLTEIAAEVRFGAAHEEVPLSGRQNPNAPPAPLPEMSATLAA
jgi:hypothetical protein